MRKDRTETQRDISGANMEAINRVPYLAIVYRILPRPHTGPRAAFIHSPVPICSSWLERLAFPLPTLFVPLLQYHSSGLLHSPMSLSSSRSFRTGAQQKICTCIAAILYGLGYSPIATIFLEWLTEISNVFLHVAPFKFSRSPTMDSKAIHVKTVCTWWSGGHFQSSLDVVGSFLREIASRVLGLKHVDHLKPIRISLVFFLEYILCFRVRCRGVGCGENKMSVV